MQLAEFARTLHRYYEQKFVSLDRMLAMYV